MQFSSEQDNSRVFEWSTIGWRQSDEKNGLRVSEDPFEKQTNFYHRDSALTSQDLYLKKFHNSTTSAFAGQPNHFWWLTHPINHSNIPISSEKYSKCRESNLKQLSVKQLWYWLHYAANICSYPRLSSTVTEKKTISWSFELVSNS